MEYITRSLEGKFLKMSRFFKVVLVTGARQVGKTTMLMHLAEYGQRTYVTLDNLMIRNLAKTDPALFFQTYKPPILIDEIQYAPELFGHIKLMCDESEETGRFWLSSSQRYSMIKDVHETLAGRLCVLDLHSLSRNEIQGVAHEGSLDFSLSALLERQRQSQKQDLPALYDEIWRGGMPQMQLGDTDARDAYYESYIDTHLMRDVTQIGGVTDAVKFRKFLTASASLVARHVNYKTLAEASDISQPTAKEWLKLIEGLGIVYLLKPYEHPALKRTTKTPKLYFLDTGLCAYLSMWLTPDALRTGAASSAYYECYVVSELIKAYAYGAKTVKLSHYRDAKAKEISLLIEHDQLVHPLEIRQSAALDLAAIKKFGLLDKAGVARGPGGIVCLCQEVVPIDEKSCFIPSFVI